MPDDPDESFIIHTILRSRPSGSVPFTRSGSVMPDAMAPGDDAARVTHDTVVTVDAMVEDIHWDDKLSASDVGWKLVAANASDINAMGALPQWAVLTLCLPRPLDEQWVQEFAHGLGQALEEWSIQLVGGDTTGSPAKRMLSLTLTGTADKPVGRTGACGGDDIWISGHLGGPAAGFFLEGADRLSLRRPHPPIGLVHALSQADLVTSMMDISDGLVRDLPRLCRASDVGALVDRDALPMHTSLSAVQEPLPYMVGFGEEYELLCTAAPCHREQIQQIACAFNTKMTRVGAIQDDEEGKIILTKGHWPAPLFSHFSEATA